MSRSSFDALSFLKYRLVYSAALLVWLLCLPGLSVAARDYSVGSYSELRNAIQNARDGDTIRVTFDITMAGHPEHIDKRITVEGNGRTINGNGRYRIFVVAESGNLTLTNARLVQGKAQDGDPPCVSGESWTDSDGGAICNRGALTVLGSSFLDNAAKSGGAIYNSGRANISDSSFTGNRVVLDGGAIQNNEGTLAVSDSAFSQNFAHQGGAVFNWGDGARLSISASSFVDNYADRGGAAFNDGEAHFSGSSFDLNRASQEGGAIWNGGTTRVSGSSFNGNYAEAGGALSSSGQTDVVLIVSSSSFNGNSADYGGAIGFQAEASISDSSFHSNTASVTGGAISAWGEGNISNVVVANNSANTGGGLYVRDDRRSVVRVRNSILADNRGGDCVNEIDLDESLNNIIKDGSCLDSTGIQADPMLGEWVEAANGRTGYFPLRSGSPAIDAAAASACSETDQLGNARPYGGGCDIGAVEYAETPAAADQPLDQSSDTDIVGDVPGAANFPVASYREMANAIRMSSDGDLISLTGDITMTDHPRHIDKRITVEGNGHTISGDDRYRIFVVAESGDLTINDLNLIDGRARDGDPKCIAGRDSSDNDGGAICSSGSLTISESSFNGNSAAGHGGAIFSYGEGASVSVSGSSFSGNSAKWGGAIYSRGGDGASLTVSGSSFSGNSASDDGGAIYSGGGANLSVSGSSFSGNSAEKYGGGAIRIYSGSATLSHLTLVDNSANDSGGGIHVHEYADSVRLRNSILANNRGGDCVNDIDLAESLNNIIKDGSCLDATGMAVDPMLGEWVEATEESTGYFPLLAGSPAIDAAADSACTDSDQLGNVRPQGDGCDIGAIEYAETPVAGSQPADQSSDTDIVGDVPGAVDFSVVSYSDLANAIRLASDGDTITLFGDITMTDHPPHIDKRITVEGNGHTISGDDRYRMFVVLESGDLTINSLNLVNGIAEEGDPECIDGVDWSDTVGGAICSSGNLTISDSSFSGNSASSGGAILSYGDGASLSVSGSSFSGNSAELYGGAIISSGEGANLSVSGSSFSGNSAELYGGAIISSGEGANLSVSESSFSDNSAEVSGGAIRSYGELSVSGSSFLGNSADYGGAITSGGEATISDSSFNGNSARSGGAIFSYGEGASLSVNDSSFSGNSASDDGGAIYSGGGANLSVSGSSFSGNSADEIGGAIRIYSGTATLSHLTLMNNRADGSGGGIAASEYASSVRIRNSILANNAGGDCAFEESSDLKESLNNIISDGACRGTRTDPRLGEWVEATDDSTGYFPLLAGSPAIDAAADSACTDSDQLGNVRPQGDGCDIGAIEFGAVAERTPDDGSKPDSSAPGGKAPDPASPFISAADLQARHSIKAAVQDEYELIYPAALDDVIHDLKASLKPVDALNFALTNPAAGIELCYAETTGLAFLFLPDHPQWQARPLQYYKSGADSCVFVANEDDGVIVRSRPTKDSQAAWQSAMTGYRLDLAAGVIDALPNPAAAAAATAACFAADVFNSFQTTPVARFSYSFSVVLYDDTKIIYSAIESAVDAMAAEIVDLVMEESSLLYDVITPYVDQAAEYVAAKMDESGIEAPTEAQLEQWLDEFLHELWETVELFGEGLHKMHEIHVLKELSKIAGRAVSSAAKQGLHLKPGLSHAQQAGEIIKAGGKGAWRGALQLKSELAKTAKTVYHAAANKAAGLAKLAKVKALMVKKLTVYMVAQAKLAIASALTPHVVLGAQTFAAGAVFAVLARGTTGAIHDIISGRHDAFFAQRKAEAREIRDRCYNNVVPELGNLSDANRLSIVNGIKQLFATYGMKP